MKLYSLLLFQDHQLDCILTNMRYRWIVEYAAKLGIVKLFCHSLSYFSNCVCYFVRKYKFHESLVSDNHKFTLPYLSDSIEITPLQLAEWIRTKNSVTCLFEAIFELQKIGYTIVFTDLKVIMSNLRVQWGLNLGV